MKTVPGSAGVETALEPVPPKVTNIGFARLAGKRLRREWKTMAAMIHIYCQAQHCADGRLCRECRDLLDYATVRLERCRFGEEKPTCANCPVHCYQRQRRDQMKTVMRYAGPWMLWLHPILAVGHWLDGFRKAPAITADISPPVASEKDGAPM